MNDPRWLEKDKVRADQFGEQKPLHTGVTMIDNATSYEYYAALMRAHAYIDELREGLARATCYTMTRSGWKVEDSWALLDRQEPPEVK